MPTRFIELDAAAIPAHEAPPEVARWLGEAVDGGEFVALVRMPSHTERPRGPQATASVRLLTDLRPGLTARCRGVAFVTDAATANARGRDDQATTRLWGCPAATFTDEDEARGWLAARRDPDRAAPSGEASRAEAGA